MRNKSSLKDRILALVLSIVLVLGMLPANVIAQEITNPVAQIGDATYKTLEEALAAVPKGANQAVRPEVTTIKLLRDVAYAFDVGTSNGSTTMNLKLDLAGKTLTLSPSVGSVGTKSSGIRVLAYSKLEIVGGTVVCSSVEADNVKVGIANYSDLTLTDVTLEAGAKTLYTINNRGKLTLNGATKVTANTDAYAITNDPYNLYYTTDVPASVTCTSKDVVVDSMLVERYERNSQNKGGVELNISAGTFGKIVEDTATSVPVNYNVTGGTICVSTTAELMHALDMVKAGSAYTCPENPVTIKLLADMEGSFDVGTSNGTAPKNVLLDMNNKTLTLKPGIGSNGTKTNGIRVLAYSKLAIVGGTIVCSSEEADNVKVGIANYSDLTLDGVTVLAGAKTLYTINNRGALTLKGATKVTADTNSVAAITNDPYDLYYTTDKDASLTCESDDVVVDNILVERYARNSANKGGIKLNISAGYFGEIKDDEKDDVPFEPNVTGGKFGADISGFCKDGYTVIEDGNGGYILKQEQEGFGFAKDTYTVVFGADDNEFTAILNNAVGNVTYTVIEGDDVAMVDAKGKLTIYKAGTVKVKAVADGDDAHIAAEDTYTLVVEPAYADVESYFNGTVDGSKTENTVVTVEDVTLEWIAKNDAGRPQDGWWVGVKVKVPAGVKVNKALTASVAANGWTGVSDMEIGQDSIELWGLITAEYLQKFINESKTIDYIWQFSWDGDNVYEQKITVSVKPEKVRLKQSGFAFEIENDNTTYGLSYEVKVPQGGQAGTVTYSVTTEGGQVTDVAEFDNGNFIIHKAGTVKITATKSGEHFESISDSYILVIELGDRPNVQFENATPEVTYSETENTYNQAVQGVTAEDKVTYVITEELYEGSNTYKGEPVNVADIDSATGKLTIHQSGTVTVQAIIGKDDRYDQKTLTYTLTVKKALQSAFKFENPTVEVTYGQNNNEYSQSVVGAMGGGALLYEIVDEKYGDLPANVANIDKETGIVTIYQSGVVTVRATKGSDTQYADATPAEYTLTIKKAQRTWKLDHDDATIPLTYGVTSFTNELKDEGTYVGTQPSTNPVYTLKDSFAAAAIGAEIDSQSGEVTFGDSTGKVGQVTVEINVAADERYEGKTTSYTLVVDYLKNTPKPETDGETKNTSGWYTGNVLIKAPAGYTIAYDNKLSTVFEDEIPYTESGINSKNVYLKDAQGYITAAIPMENIKLDTQAPVDVKISYTKSPVQKVLNTITFGIYKVDKLNVTISAKDETSGIAQLIYHDGKQEHTLDYPAVNFLGEKSKEVTFEIPAQYRNKIKLKAVDVAGNVSGLTESEEYIVLDTAAPELLTPLYTFETGECNEYNDIIYTQGKVTVGFAIKESNFDLSNLPVVTVNGLEEKVTWKPGANTDEWQTSFERSAEGDYVVELLFTDAAENEKIQYKQEFRIDKGVTKITIADAADNASFAGEISKTEKTAVITIEEHNFDPKDVELTVIAKNILKQDVAVMDYKAYAKNPANWDHNGDIHTLNIALSEDAVYDIRVDYKDLAGNAEAAEDKVTVDKTPVDPSTVEFTYETPVPQLILQTITFGFYKAETVVTVTAKDDTSGVASIQLTYNIGDNASAINKAFEEANLTVNPNGNVFTGSYTMKAEADGSFSVVITDNAGNVTTVNDRTNRIVVDNTDPKITVTYGTGANNTAIFRNAAKQPVNTFAEATQVYYNGNATATISINEANFFEGVKDDNNNVVHNVLIKVTKTDDLGNTTITEYLPAGAAQLVSGAIAVPITWTTNGDDHTATIPFSGNGDYVLEIEYTDFSGNQAAINGGDGTTGVKTYTSKIVTVDDTDPKVEILNPQDGKIHNPKHTAQIQITEHNFDPKDVELTVIAKNILGEDVTLTANFVEFAKNPAKWDHNGDIHTLDVPFTDDAVYEIKVNYSDLAGRMAVEKTDTFTVDKTPVDPSTVEFIYETPVPQLILQKITFGFYKAETIVKVKVEDDTSGVASIDLTYTREDGASEINKAEEKASLTVVQDQQKKNVFTATYTIKAQTRGNFSIFVVDNATNKATFTDTDDVVITDTEASTVQITYTSLGYKDGFRDANDNVVDSAADAVRFYYNKNVEAKITITEANFFEGVKDDSNNIIHKVMIKVTKTDDNGNVTVTEYLPQGAAQLVAGAKTANIAWTTEGDVHTTSITLAEDGDYVLELEYQDFSENKNEITGTDGNSGNVTYKSRNLIVDKTQPIIEVSYDNNSALNENCYKDNRTATITVKEHNFKAEEFVLDVKTKNLLGDITVMDYAAYAKNPKNWQSEGNVHTLKVPFEKDATYTVDMSYTDMAGNAAADFAAQTFVVDHTVADNIKITYTKPVFDKIIETLSFGFYQADVVVTVTAEDVTSGVDYFELTYTRDEKATDAHTDDFMQKLVAKPGSDAKTFTASHTVPAQARGSFSVKVFDRAGNDSSHNDKGVMIVTDTVSPQIKVDYAAKDAATKVHFVDSQVKDVNTFDKAANAFYGGDVVATITVDEANFFEGKKAGENNDEIVHEIVIKVTKTDDNGKVTVKEYLPAGATQLVDGAQTETIQWTTKGDTHTANITFADDGDYVLEITYSDFSKNDSQLTGNDGNTGKKTYTSKVITVDETAPVINVAYGNVNVINTIEGRKYFDKTQSAVITVTEHNFRAADIAAAVTAKNVVGNDVTVADFAAQLADAKNWKHEGNVHTAEIKYTVDANYIFDIDFVDLALNASADYQQDLFTVDTTAPANLKVAYSTSVLEQIKESITFGYYNAMMTVTITAEDETSGIYHFAYSYIKGQDVSGVNAELLDEAIKEADITFDGKQATATFTIPKMVLGDDNQFNGTVEFTAFDRSEVSTELKDSKVIVVDNITPTSKITYNAPVQNANGISYYAGNIDATIEITEANFDSSDVVVTVTKNGANYPVKVSWKDNSVDVHTGTFTLTEDGDYFVSVEYKDKSGNKMASYTSNELTLDATAPTIKVSNIKANSANKDEKYGFVITFNDTNMDATAMKPVLKAVKQTEPGIYTTVDIELGEAETVVNGQTYTYTIEDLPDDGLYTLTCEVKDMSENGMSQIILDDGEVYDQVQFSINRDGSAFGYGNQFSEELVNQYYVYSVNEDVVIVEVNVDPVEEYKITLNGNELVEGTDYTTTQTSKDGEWSKRTYTINKSKFEAEGEYSIIVTSVDKAETTAFSDVKNLFLAFVVDQTKPAITITGMEAGGRYRTDKQTVTLSPTDEGGKLKNLKVILLDSDGNPLKDDKGNDISVAFDKSGEELLKYLEENDQKVIFEIPEGLNNQVRIICNDCAVNEDGVTNEYNELFKRITVSPNRFVIFYANTPLFVGTIAGVSAAAGLIVFLIKRKGGKKSKAKKA